MAKAPDVSSGQVIASAHINLINDSIYTWQQDIDGNNKALTNVIHLQLNATSLPGSPTAGTTVVDSGAANVLKWFDGSGWKTVVAQGDTASLAQPLTVAGNAPAVIIRNTANKVSVVNHSWNNATQWVSGTGLPANTNFSFTEYTNGVYQGVRMMLFKGGRIAIGSTTDDTINTLQVAGPVKMTGVTHAYVEKSTDYTPTSADHTINCIDAVTITLPTAVGITGRVYYIKNSHTSSCTVNTTASQLMDDQLSIVLAQYECIKVQSTGSGWIII